MSKAFTKEGDGENEDEPEIIESHSGEVKNYMTPAGIKAMQDELKQLSTIERPKVVEIVSWAAGNGDRSENGDYIYGKKRLREIDRRLRYLSKRLESAVLVDPRQQQGLEQVFFGATVTYAGEDGTEHTVQLVGVDEADIAKGKISWLTPLAKALMKRKVGDEVELRAPGGVEMIEVVKIDYKIK